MVGKEIDKDEIRSRLIEYVESITEKSKGNGMYVCPLCHSGRGKNHTGAFSIKDDNWKCFSCGRGGDIFDLYGEMNKTNDFIEQFNGLNDFFGNNIKKIYTQDSIHTSVYTQEEVISEDEKNMQEFFSKAHSDIDKTLYWKKRGLSRDLMDAYNIGYVEEWRHPKYPNAPATPRLIIPTGTNSYLARYTEELKSGTKSPTKQKVGKSELFNKDIIENATKPIYVVEGEIDALSIIEVGGLAIALGSTVGVDLFISYIKDKEIKQPLIIAMDNDKPGMDARDKLVEKLTELDIEHYVYNPYGQFKDANDSLIKNEEAFALAIEEGSHLGEFLKEEKKNDYLEKSTAKYIEGYLDRILAKKDNPVISTKFERLDDILEGGLHEGLYIVGAISSLGKTTLVMQIADQIAQSGQDVLIFSLEMSREELMAKSISRHTVIKALDDNNYYGMENAKTTRGILSGARYKKYSGQDFQLIKDAIEDYKEYAEHVYIIEGIGNIGVQQIRECVENHRVYTGNTPAVIVDYLQILAPYDPRSTDKQNTDKAVLELKRMSRDYNAAVIGISSFNRENYKNEVSMEAFKESGAIEYSSDVLIGLQYKGVGDKITVKGDDGKPHKVPFDINEARQKNPREIELVILKNRNGKAGNRIGFKYYPMFNYFEEMTEADEYMKG